MKTCEEAVENRRIPFEKRSVTAVKNAAEKLSRRAGKAVEHRLKTGRKRYG